MWSGRWPGWSRRGAQTYCVPHLNLVGMNALGGWRVRIGGPRDGDGERMVTLGQIKRILRNECWLISNPGSIIYCVPLADYLIS